ncbi:unnamed protein product [Schistocephalus solidus]|uniref:DNA replication licensing factor MCM3 n=1 Tax=Schistocephalus solidus TaxID=70667 RepID=A0A183SNM2_SCHSO|nr:unnamed protein product [Schistocephalus solidus]
MALFSRRILNFPSEDIVDLLARSIAPSIYGHQYIKQAILYQLLGGVERILTNGSRIRGDINLLLLGDPSVAKSQFLRFVLHVAHLAIPTTGRGSSGVGLTAAVTTDHETGERQLEAGAMVLADRGIVCIDEFDKMSDIDRTAIHEVMEQGRVTIAKAGIQAQLNARCSVLGAANPVYGRYDQYKTPMENIGLQDSLLSRFDLLFLVLDKADPEGDRSIAEHVIQAHQYRAPGEQEGEALPLQDASCLLATFNLDPNVAARSGQGADDATDDIDAEERRKDSSDQVFEDKGRFFQGSKRTKNSYSMFFLIFFSEYFTISFLKKYIHIARQLKPQLSKEAANILCEKYCDIRMQQDVDNSTMRRTQPVTARTLETLIRLSTANAKARMSKTVTKRDAEAAVELISYVLFKEVLEKSKKKRPRVATEEGSGGSGEESEEDTSARRPRKRVVTAASGAGTTDDPYAFEASQTDAAGPSTTQVTEGGDTQLSASRLRMLSTLVSRAFQERRVEQLSVAEVTTQLFTKALQNLYLFIFFFVEQVTNFVMEQTKEFSRSDIKTGLEMMHDTNRIMLTTDDVWLI